MVTDITTENHKVLGVLFNRKNDGGNITMNALADEVIANTAMHNVAFLLPGEYGNELKKQLQDQQTGASLLTVYFGFNKSLRELGYRYYSTFIYDNTIKSQKDILNNNAADFASRNFTFIDYGQVDSGLAPAGKSVGTLCCIDYLKDWECLDRKAYISKKEQVAAAFISRLEKLIPGFENAIEYCEVGTPHTLKRYTLNPGGAVYGFAQTPSRKAIDLSKLPENLHFASAWGKIGGGFSGVIYSGYLCAMNMIRKKPGVK
jgi:phytoene dehydrogenase-like protein